MRRVPALALVGLALFAGAQACTEPRQLETARISFEAESPTYINQISIEVSGDGIPVPLVYNLTIAAGTATGTFDIPAGSARHIIARAYDVAGINTHRADTTVDLVAGVNPPIALTMHALNGSQTITITFGTIVLSISPGSDAMQVGDSRTFHANVTGAPAGVVHWASSNPAIVSIDANGQAMALTKGTATVVATYLGLAASSAVTVDTAGVIAFMTLRDGNEEIYSEWPDGSRVLRLTNNSAHDEAPRWSPDGKLLSFQSDLTGDFEVTVMNADGSGRHVISPDPGKDAWPTVSPDGNRIAFESDRTADACGSGIRIFVMNIDGSGVTCIASTGSAAEYPDWSPDGNTILYWATVSGAQQIWTVHPDGSGNTLLTAGPSDNSPRWSPDGSKIVFLRGTEVWSMNSDGTGQVQLTTGFTDRFPTWSPNGRRIIFDRVVGGIEQLITMNPDGSDVVPVTVTSSRDMQGSWGR